MRYLALLAGQEPADPQTPEEVDAEMAEYKAFGERNGAAIVCGEALQPSNTIVTVRPGAGAPVVTAGPYAESTEVVGGFYVLEAETLDDAIDLARQIPAARHGEVELRPFVEWFERDDEAPAGHDGYFALIRDTPGPANTPGTPEWEQGLTDHGRFGEVAGDALRAGGALHPVDTATTVRVRDGEVIVSDGPYTEFAEVVGGIYLFAAPTPEDAHRLAAQIPNGPKGSIELIPVWELG
jgi:hypothetical protein